MKWQWLQIEWFKLQSATIGMPLSVCVGKVKAEHFHLHMRRVGKPS